MLLRRHREQHIKKQTETKVEKKPTEEKVEKKPEKKSAKK